MSLASFGVRKPVVANLVMLAIIGAGLIFGTGLRREFFPETRPTQVLVSAPYPGASPDEVEDSLATKIEDRVADLEDVVELNTTIGEGFASILIEFAEGADVSQKVFDVKSEMDALQDLPPESERIVVEKFEPNLPVIVLSLFGDAPERVLKRRLQSIRDDLLTLRGMGDLSVSGVRADEITVEVRPDALIAHRLSLPAVADRVSAAMIELPGGSVRAPTANTAIRTMGADEVSEAVRDIVVKAGADGQVLRLSDIAAVSQGFEDTDVVSRLNGEPAMSLTVFKVGDEDAVAMSEIVKAYAAGLERRPYEPSTVERLASLAAGAAGREPEPSERREAYELGLDQPPLPAGVNLAITTDLARFIVGRLDLLTRNALWGGLLVLLTLVVLLNWRVAFWVALGLIVSLLGTLAVMHFAGISLNLLTMFGLIVVLGLLVDDAIVVAENITARHEQGEPALDAAVSGTRQVNWPVVATVLTTICAFLPLALIQGQIGDLMEVFPYVVACALLVSLVESLFILPSHMGHSLVHADRARERAAASGRVGALARLDRAAHRLREALFTKLLVPWYTKLLRLALRHRYLTLACAIAAVTVSAGMVAGGRLPFTFMSSNDAETVNIELRMPVGTPIEGTDPIVRKIERAALAQPEVTSVYAGIGGTSGLDGTGGSSGPHLAQIILELKPVEQRDRASDGVILGIRKELGELPGVKSLRMEEVAGGPDGPALTLAVAGRDPVQLLAAAAEIERLLEQYDGVYDVANDNDIGRRELRLRLRDGADELGFTVESVARQVRGSVFGLEAHTFAGEREDVDVRVLLPEHMRRSLASLETMQLFTPAGDPVPLPEVVVVTEATGYAQVKRLDRERIVTVTAEADSAVANPEQVAADLRSQLAELERRFPGVEVLERGRQEEVADSFATLPIGMAAATGLIYVVLAWLFSSYLQPLIVLCAVPFATVGMIWGHLLLGFDLQLISLIGFVALTGVVVNDSLIFMEFYNERRAAGLGHYDAAVAAGRARLRAIMLTTITTVLGLLPLMLETSFQARFLIPMAITISFGLMSATVLILIVLPSLLLIARDAGAAINFLWTGKANGSDPERPTGADPNADPDPPAGPPTRNDD